MPKTVKRSQKECWFMAGDFERIASVHGDLRVTAPRAGFVTPQSFKRGKKLFGSSLGPPDNTMVAEVYCELPRAGGRECASYELRRTGPGSRLFDKKRVSVGNEHGLKRQMARDAARLWGCPPPQESGFDGPGAARSLTTPERHQLAIARRTLKMNDPMAAVMGGMTKSEARAIIKRLTGKAPGRR